MLHLNEDPEKAGAKNTERKIFYNNDRWDSYTRV
jgi:hypothetical protein